MSSTDAVALAAAEIARLEKERVDVKEDMVRLEEKIRTETNDDLKKSSAKQLDAVIIRLQVIP